MTDWRLFLVHNPDVCSGQLTTKGTRIPVTVFLDSIAEGSSRDALLAQSPDDDRHQAYGTFTFNLKKSGFGAFDLIPGIRDLPPVVKIILIAIVVWGSLLFILPLLGFGHRK